MVVLLVSSVCYNEDVNKDAVPIAQQKMFIVPGICVSNDRIVHGSLQYLCHRAIIYQLPQNVHKLSRAEHTYLFEI